MIAHLLDSVSSSRIYRMALIRRISTKLKWQDSFSFGVDNLYLRVVRHHTAERVCRFPCISRGLKDYTIRANRRACVLVAARQDASLDDRELDHSGLPNYIVVLGSAGGGKGKIITVPAISRIASWACKSIMFPC